MNHRLRSISAFTLLEMLLALSVLSIISVLVGTMWMQARGWSEENSSSNESMRLQRACEFMRAQWADRRSSASLDDQNRRVLATPEALTFVTATPILFTDWPMVIATYEIEREPGSPLGELARFTLRYTETPLSRLDKAPDPSSAQTRSLALLSGVHRLRWERYGTADAPAPLREQDQLRETTEPADEEGPEKPEDRVIRWRPFTRPDSRLTPAVRLLGEYHKEPLSCLFVVEALR